MGKTLSLYPEAKFLVCSLVDVANDHHAHMMGAKAETTTVHNHGAMAETTHNHGAMTTDSMGNTEGVMDHGAMEHGAMMMQVHEINLQLLPLEVLIC